MTADTPTIQPALADAQPAQQPPAPAPAAADAGALLEQVVVGGDLARLTPAQRLDYYRRVCDSLGLNPLTKPFDYLHLNGRLVLYATRSTSMVVDEGLHIASGYSILRTGDYRLVEEHPPLIKMWDALPLLPVPDIPDPRQFPAWEEALNRPEESIPLLVTAQNVVAAYAPVDRLVLPARTMAALVGLILAAVVYRWAKDLGGERAGLLALVLLVLDPNILAHSAVVGTDLGAAAMVVVLAMAGKMVVDRKAEARIAEVLEDQELESRLTYKSVSAGWFGNSVTLRDVAIHVAQGEEAVLHISQLRLSDIRESEDSDIPSALRIQLKGLDMPIVTTDEGETLKLASNDFASLAGCWARLAKILSWYASKISITSKGLVNAS